MAVQWARLIKRARAGSTIPTQSHTVVVVDKPEMLLIPFGDLHIGSRACDWPLLEGTLRYAWKRGCYLLGMGDYLEMAGTTSPPGSIWEQFLDPWAQFRAVRDLLRPFAEDGRLLGLLDGNHELRMWKTAGVRPAQLLADELGVPHFEDAASLEVKVKAQSYYIHAIHGSSGAMYPHTKIGALIRISYGIDADIYLMGHVHHVDATGMTIDEAGRPLERKRLFALTGHFLRYEGYPRRLGMLPGKRGVVKIKLYGDKHDFHASI